MKKYSKVMLIAMLSLGFLNSACYGPFSLTKKLYRWNSAIDGKWAREGVFLGLAVIPVYGLGLLADALVFNSIEFWTGDNPMSTKSIRTLKNGEAEAVMVFDPSKRRLRIDNFQKGRPVSTMER